MKKIALALTIVFLLALTPKVYAHDDEAKGPSFRFRLTSQNQPEEEDEEDANEFHLRGQIDSLTAGSFVVNGITVLIDPSQVDEYKQKGILNEGDWVKVEGEVIGESYYAEEVMTIGEGQGRFKIEIDSEDEEEVEEEDEDDEDISPTPTATQSPSPTPTESVSPTPTESVSPTPTESLSPTPTETALNTQVSVKAEGPIELVAEFLQQVLAYLQGLIS